MQYDEIEFSFKWENFEIFKERTRTLTILLLKHYLQEYIQACHELELKPQKTVLQSFFLVLALSFAMWCSLFLRNTDTTSSSRLEWWLSMPNCVSPVCSPSKNTSPVPISSRTTCMTTDTIGACLEWTWRITRSAALTTLTVPLDGIISPPLFLSTSRW